MDVGRLLYSMHERSISIGEGAAGDETATDAPFSVTSVLEVDGQLVVRVRGTALGIVESNACREIAERIATLQGWDPDGIQAERSFGGVGQFTREFAFVKRRDRFR